MFPKYTSESYWKTAHLIKNGKIKTLILSLNETNNIIHDVLEEYFNMEKELENLKSSPQKFNSKTCHSCGDLQQVIQTAATKLSLLNNTQNYKSIEEIILLLNKETHTLTPEESCDNVLNSNACKSTSVEEDIMDEISLSDIEGTPTGRRSPILDYKKPIKRAKEVSQTDSEERGLANNCSTPEPKLVKLSQASPSCGPKAKSRLKQLRLSLSKPKKADSIIDLTICTPDNILKTIKTEENEDIEPSPTSSIKPDFSALYKPIGGSKKSQSPCKFKRPTMPKLPILKDENQKPELNHHEDSFNLLHPSSKGEIYTKDALTSDETLCEDVIMANLDGVKLSPLKVPLTENKNAVNVKSEYGEDSLSVLPQNDTRNIKPDKYDPIYKEPTVRKKAEKLALPGWSCDKCKNFYDVIYRDNPGMLRKLMAECSRHRGRRDPARPRTPPGYWAPRWSVPTDTETFNRQNNV